MQSEILQKATEWANNSYFDESDRQEVQKLIDREDIKELTERFYKDLEFGTGGLRAILGMGANRMNKYNVRKATQAMANVILKQESEEYRACVSYDCRKFSDEFAKEVATVFAANGIKAFLFDTMTPVPMLSFAVRYKKANAGVMVTASHNPKIYNGYKAYWSDGAQVTPPNDKAVIDEFNNINSWDQIKYTSFEEEFEKSMIEFITDDVKEAYYQVLESKVLEPEMCKEQGDQLKVVYTPIHGTGVITVPYMAKRLGFGNFITLEEQATPDSDFPTVPSPNPENPQALSLAINKMREVDADLVMGTDPDTDRLGVALIHKEEVIFLNGNEIAVLMLDYIAKKRNEKNLLGENPLVIKSIVTSPLQDTICKKFNISIESTLTGFKWMGGLMKEYENQGKPYDFVFASEESFGYMGHNEVRDKDGVCAVTQMLELALFHKLEGRNLVEALDSIYEEYGFYKEHLISLDYLGLEGSEKIARIMNHFRNDRENNILDEKIVSVEDYLTLEKTNLNENSKIKLNTTVSNVLGFDFESENKLYLRPSGTEPKIKFYIMVRENQGSLEDKKLKANSKIQKLEKYILDLTEKL